MTTIRKLHNPNEGKGLDQRELARYRKRMMGADVKTDILRLRLEDLCSRFFVGLQREHPKLHDILNKKSGCLYKLICAVRKDSVGEKENTAYSTGLKYDEKEELWPTKDTELAAYALGVLYRGGDGKRTDAKPETLTLVSVIYGIEDMFNDVFQNWNTRGNSRNPWSTMRHNIEQGPEKPGDSI